MLSLFAKDSGLCTTSSILLSSAAAVLSFSDTFPARAAANSAAPSRIGPAARLPCSRRWNAPSTAAPATSDRIPDRLVEPTSPQKTTASSPASAAQAASPRLSRDRSSDSPPVPAIAIHRANMFCCPVFPM